RNFHQPPTVLTGPVTKSIRTNTDIGMKYTVVAYYTSLPDNGTRPYHGMVTNSSIIKNGNVGIKYDPVSQNYIFSHITSRSNFTTFTYNSSFIHYGTWMYFLQLPGRLRLKGLGQFSHG